MKSFLAALQFLTVFPLRRAFPERSLEHASFWFPLVGLIIGLVVAGLDAIGTLCRIPPVILSVLSVAMLAALTGGLHMDGLADTADGFLGARDRARVLEIMRDSRIGTMGALALLFAILLKAAALVDFEGTSRFCALVLAPLAGRSMQLATMSLLPYARGPGGLATAFIRRRRRLFALWAFLWTGVGAVLLFGFVVGLGLIVVCLVGTTLLAAWSDRRIGGFTGDTLGATSEAIETLVLVCACILVSGT
jgi:adenosylcobinamide-GDP ribazoletransferase